jgi:hypothetical protein
MQPSTQPVAPIITASNIAASAHIPLDAELVPVKTYVSSAKNSTFIMPSGEILQFAPAGHVGHLTTASPHAQAELDAAIRRGNPIRLLDSASVVQRMEKTAQERAMENMLAANADKVDAARMALLALQNGATSVAMPEGVENKTLAGAVSSQSVIAAASAPSKAK